MSFEGILLDCDVCTVRKIRQLAHSKAVNYKVNHSFQLVFVDLMGPITPEALGGYKYVSKISDEHTKWAEIYLLKSKGDALNLFQSFVQSVATPSGSRVERLGVDKGSKYISNEYKGYRLRTGVSLEYAGINMPQQIGIYLSALDRLLQPWLSTKGFCGFSGGS